MNKGIRRCSNNSYATASRLLNRGLPQRKLPLHDALNAQKAASESAGAAGAAPGARPTGRIW